MAKIEKYARSVGMTLPTQISSGEILLQVLQRKYPGVRIEITRPGYITQVRFSKKTRDGRTAQILISITEDILKAGPEVIAEMMDDSVRRLNNYVEKMDQEDNNPSSREFGI